MLFRSDDNGLVRWGGSPPDKIVIGGSFLFDEEGAAWLRGALPPTIHIAAASPAAEPLRSTLALLRAEAGRGVPGEAVIVDRLADILLVQALRAQPATDIAPGRPAASPSSGCSAIRHTIFAPRAPPKPPQRRPES